MKPKCQLRKSWPAIKPKGCKVHSANKHKRHKPAHSSNASAASQARSESIVERPKANKSAPPARKITPIAMSTTPSSQLSLAAASSMTSSNSAGLPSQNNSFKRIESMVDKRIKSHNRQPSFKKGLKTIKRMTKIFGRS